MWNPYYDFVNYHPRAIQYRYQPQYDGAIYDSDEFRMYSFKIKRCPRQRSHDWTQCPFAHRGERAARRDPRRFNYCGFPCPEFRDIGVCMHGDACPFSHGVFEQWLHPERYRTRLCSASLDCQRQVCFFAHTLQELRAEDPSLLKFPCVHQPWPETPTEPTVKRILKRAVAPPSPVAPPAYSKANKAPAYHASWGETSCPNKQVLVQPHQASETSAFQASWGETSCPNKQNKQFLVQPQHAGEPSAFPKGMLNAFAGGNDFLSRLSGVREKKGKEKMTITPFEVYGTEPNAPYIGWVEEVVMDEV